MFFFSSCFSCSASCSTYCSCCAYEGSLNLLCVTLGCFLSGAFTEITGKRRAMQVSKRKYTALILCESIHHIAISTAAASEVVVNPIVLHKCFSLYSRALFSLLGIHSITNYVETDYRNPRVSIVVPFLFLHKRIPLVCWIVFDWNRRRFNGIIGKKRYNNNKICENN